jgi:hypothetical protein
MLDNIGFRGLTQGEAAGQGGLIKQLAGKFFFGQRDGIHKRLHRCFSVTVFAAVRPFMVILPYPFIQVKLYFIDVAIYLFTERNGIKLVFTGLICTSQDKI